MSLRRFFLHTFLSLDSSPLQLFLYFWEYKKVTPSLKSKVDVPTNGIPCLSKKFLTTCVGRGVVLMKNPRLVVVLHSALVVKTFLGEYGIPVSAHPPNSPDLRVIFFLFLKVKEALMWSCQVKSDGDYKHANRMTINTV